MERKKILRFRSKILDVINLTSSVKHLTFPVLEEFDFYPGQFISLILNKDGREIKRPYSIASQPSRKSMDLCIKIVQNGLVTPLIDGLKKGDEIEVLGPMGDFIVKDFSKHLIFISTGTGIGPFRSIINYLLENSFKNKITLLTGYRTEEEVLYESEFKELEKKFKNFFYHRILSRSEKEENGYVQKLVEKNLFLNSHYYICGLKGMVNSVKDLLSEKGIPKENIFFEKYD
ncbi:MAG: FAD-dependent oxidoreductase [Nanoarchaeota archaeon]